MIQIQPSIQPQSQRHIEMLTLASAEPTIAALCATGETFDVQILIRVVDLAYDSVKNQGFGYGVQISGVPDEGPFWTCLKKS